MILRFRLFKTDGTSSTPTTAVEEIVSGDLSKIKMTIIVDGTTILNGAYLNTISFPISTVTTVANSYDVDLNLLNNSYFKLEIDLPSVETSTTVYLKIEKDGNLTYENTFTVFGYDLGNNPNETNGAGDPINYNTPFDIYMIAAENGNGSNLNGTHIISGLISFTAYRRPFTNEVYVYMLSSSDSIVALDNSGNIEYYTSDIEYSLENNSTEVSTSRNSIICSSDLTDLDFNITYKGIDGSTSAEISLDRLLNAAAWIPDFTTYVDCNNCTDCVNYLDNLNIITNIDYTTLAQVYVDDIEVYPYDDQVITYEVFDFNGNVVSSSSSTFDINSGGLPYDPIANQSDNFNLGNEGNYIYQTTLSVDELYSCIITGEIKGCNPASPNITDDCGTISLNNKTSNDIEYNIYKVTNNNSFVFDSTTTVSAGTIGSLSVTDGVYKIEYNYNNETYIKIIVVDCNIKECLLNKIQDILCDSTDPCCDDCAESRKDYYDLNALMLLLHTYNAIYYGEYDLILSSLNESQLSDIFELSDLLDKMAKYCEDCETKNCNSCS